MAGEQDPGIRQTEADEMIGSIALRQTAIAENACAALPLYLRGETEGITLRPHQHPVLSDLGEFFAGTAGQTGRSILIPLPPNAGKSTMAAFVADMVGIGRPPRPGHAPLKGIHLIERQLSARQVVESYKTLVPHLRVAAWNSRRGLVDLEEHHVEVMTYTAVQMMEESARRRLARLSDFLVFDEVHRALGPGRAEALRDIMRVGGSTVLAMSATPDFDEARSTCNILGIERSIKTFTPREAIDMGISNGVCLYALYSGQNVNLLSRRSSVTEKDVAGLAKNEQRNQLIVDVMHDMAKAGLRGIVQCIMGDNSEHAQKIAHMASQRDLPGANRNMIVKAVGNFQSESENERLIEDLRQGRVDAISFTKYLIESFDQPLDYLIAAAPCGSRVVMEQFTGRGARLNKRLTSIFTIVDLYSARVPKRLWTPFDVFGEECFEQGLIISPPKGGDITKSRVDSGATRSRSSGAGVGNPFKHFSKTVRRALDGIPSGTVIDELLLVRAEYPDPPEGYIPLPELPAVKDGLITSEGARYALSPLVNDAGRPLFISVRTGKYAQYVLPEAERILRERCADPAKHFTRMDIIGFLRAEGWPHPSFGVFTGACGAIGVKLTVTKDARLERADTKKLLTYLTETPLIDPSVELAVADLASALGHQSSSYLQRLIRRHSPHFAPFVNKRRKGLPPGAYKVVDAIKLSVAPELMRIALSGAPSDRTGGLSAEQVVNAVQAEVYEAMWRRKLRSQISQLAIDTFINRLTPPPRVKKTAKAVKGPDTLPPSPIDGSYILSGHGVSWAEHAACGTEDADAALDFFFSKAAGNVRRAKKVCQGCGVKGDCLLFDLTRPSGEIAGGFTAQERQGLPKEVLDWLKAQQP